ncbi:transcription factor MYBS1-like [Phragmites australis]|uniref:transcription factor MYBS1-like n=1 Tax=Phragmites australis TaxID=29695 RepID=UPI002D78202B|nr:transcription factor MYBS1-like [Phragmites australis]
MDADYAGVSLIAASESLCWPLLTFYNSISTVECAPDDGWFSSRAAGQPARTAEEVRRHYEALVEDVGAIEAGCVPLLRYAGEESAATPDSAASASAPKDGVDMGKSCSKAELESRKGIPWIEESQVEDDCQNLAMYQDAARK